MTLRQICHLLRLMRQVRRREAAAAAAATRKQPAGLAAPSSPSQKRCLPGFLRRRRTNNIKKHSNHSIRFDSAQEKKRNRNISNPCA
ncbi:hypothetical protein C0J45_5124 [Silurus meridionalis]|nr:hypothetical protein C0J45_5124 [Silurus meridionalis]